MDSGANSDGSSDEMSIRAPIRPGIRRARNHMEKFNKRRTTDKYWSGFFVVIFISWIVACQYANHFEIKKKKDNFHSNNSSDPKNTSELVHYNNIIPGSSTATINISEFLQPELDNESKDENGCPVKKKREQKELSEAFSSIGHHFLDLFTFDLSRLNDKEECNMRPIMQILCGIPILGLTFSSIYKNSMLIKQPLVIGTTFFFVALLEHLSATFYANNSITFTLLSSHKKSVSWMIPEAILLMLCIMRNYSGVRCKKESIREKISIPLNYKFTIAVGIPVFVILHLLAFYTISILQNLVWDSALFFIIAGGSCYFGLAIYYFGAIVISCAIRVSADFKKLSLKNLFRALFIVARYHFGSVCYHATLIVPRIHATFVMNDQKLKALSRYSAFDRFIITNFEVHNFLTTFTGVNGTNYPQSLKELLRFWSSYVIKRKYHYSYGYFSALSLIFLLAINSAILWLIWMYDLDDPQLSLATRAMYLKIMFVFFLAYPYLQATSDAYAFVYYRIWLRETADDIFAELMLGRYFQEFDSSDDDDDDDDDDDGGDDDNDDDANSIDSGVYNESIM